MTVYGKITMKSGLKLNVSKKVRVGNNLKMETSQLAQNAKLASRDLVRALDFTRYKVIEGGACF